MDRLTLRKEILSLADSANGGDVDIAPIIEKYSVGLDFNGQKNLRLLIENVLAELKQYGEIDFYQGDFNITVSNGGFFRQSSGKIRISYKRAKELEEQTVSRGHTINIGGDAIGLKIDSPSSGSTETFTKDSNPINDEMSKEGIRLSKATLNWTIVGIAIATLIALYIGYMQGLFS